MDCKKIVGANIKKLRLRYNEKQEILASAYNEYSGKNIKFNTISQYESGVNSPPLDFLAFISHRYNSTIDELFIPDTNITNESIQVPIHKVSFCITQEEFYEKLDIMFPISCSENSLKNTIFNKAFAKHKKMFQRVKSKGEISFGYLYDCLNYCLEKYVDLWDNEKNLESLSNALSMIFFYIAILQSQNYDAAEKQLNYFHKIDNIKYLVNVSPQTNTEMYEALEYFITHNYDKTMEYIATLRQSNEFRDLGDYYLAIAIFWGFSKSSNSSIMNRKISLEIMHLFELTGNRYCKDFLSMFDGAIEIIPQLHKS